MHRTRTAFMVVVLALWPAAGALAQDASPAPPHPGLEAFLDAKILESGGLYRDAVRAYERAVAADQRQRQHRGLDLGELDEAELRDGLTQRLREVEVIEHDVGEESSWGLVDLRHRAVIVAPPRSGPVTPENRRRASDVLHSACRSAGPGA